MPATSYSGNSLLNLFLRGVAITPPARVWLSLHTGDPGINGDANEVTAANWPAYGRQDPAQGDAIETGFTVPASLETLNTKEILFPTFDGAPSITLTHFAIWDDETAGNAIFYGALVNAKTLLTDDEIIVKVNECQVKVI